MVGVSEGNGAFELVVTPLPPHVLDGSLYSEGGDGVRVLTTRLRRRPIQEDRREEVRKLETVAADLAQKTRKLQAEIKVCEVDLAFVGKLEHVAAADKTKLDSGETIGLAKYVMDGRGEKAKALVELQEQLQKTSQDGQFVERKMRELAAGSSREELDAVIIVDKPKQAAGSIRLNYLVDAAAWLPQYKLRAGADTNDPVQVEYLAAIAQQTGEDWQGVNLLLSTAQVFAKTAAALQQVGKKFKRLPESPPGIGSTRGLRGNPDVLFNGERTENPPVLRNPG